VNRFIGILSRLVEKSVVKSKERVRDFGFKAGIKAGGQRIQHDGLESEKNDTYWGGTVGGYSRRHHLHDWLLKVLDQIRWGGTMMDVEELEEMCSGWSGVSE